MGVAPTEPQDQGRGEDAAASERGQLLADVSNAIVRIHKRFYGKGPVKARAYLSQELLTVILEGGFTRGEQTLQDRGHADEVVRSRLAMQRSVEEEFRVAVESILYRSVRSFMSANDPENDLQAEVFVLHPEGTEELADEASDGHAQRLQDTAERAGADA
ncbi:MAG TPA: Na-translocating system protein MpsC family protein [Solirubrobacteraceae bacterium]|nr:Na-translocating system protein MpsC family protein [Solirubrobacteraceae bacterium]